MSARAAVCVHLRRVFELDLRSVALLRIALGLALLFDLATRAPFLTAHYSEAGMMPVATARALYGSSVALVPHALASDHPLALQLLFAVSALAALALILGWRSRATALVCWLLLISLQLRNPLTAAMGGDKLLRIVLLWSVLLPLGARWSLDARRAPAGANDDAGRVLSFASFGFVLQLCLLYVTTGLRKNGVTWWDGSAVHYALHLDIWATGFGVWLRAFDFLMAPATYLTKAFEVFGPCLLLLTGAGRFAAVVAFSLFHLGLAAGLDIGPFPLFSALAWTALLPGWFWDTGLPAALRTLLPGARAARIAERLQQRGSRAIRGISRPENAAAAALAAYITLYVGAGMLEPRAVVPSLVPRPLVALGQLLRVNQRWELFAPDPSLADGWPMFRGRLADGSEVDALVGGPFSNAKPALLSAYYPGFRWKLLLVYMFNTSPDPARFQEQVAPLARYLCERWNERARAEAAPALRELTIETWREDSPPPRAPGEAPRDVPIHGSVVWRETCP